MTISLSRSQCYTCRLTRGIEERLTKGYFKGSSILECVYVQKNCSHFHASEAGDID